jgi:hypothetical protein
LQNQELTNNLAATRVPIFFGVLLFFAVSGFFFLTNHIVLADPDTWWHIKTGQDILTSFRVPTVETYSYTFAGHPWIAKEWLSQVLLALTFNLAGWTGVLWLTAFAVASALLALYFEIAKSIHPLLSGIAVLLIALSIQSVVVARPHVFTFLIAVIFASRLFKSAYLGQSPSYWLLILVMLWTNLHSSFTLTFVIAGFAFLTVLENTRFKDRSLIKNWLIFLVLCPTAAFINPYGVQPFLINLGFVSGLPVMSMINEWQPFNAATTPLVEIGLLAVLTALLFGGVRLSLSKTLFLILTLHMMLNHIRFVYVFFLLVPIIVYREVATQNQKISSQQWSKNPRDGFEKAISKHLPAILLVGSLAVISLLWISGPYMPPPERRIEGALAYIKSHKLDGPVLNSYDFGGPLILNNIKTYIDGRSEQLFLGEFFSSYDASGKIGGENALQKILQTYDIKWAVLSPNELQKDFLAKLPNWKETYSDKYAIIFERN